MFFFQFNSTKFNLVFTNFAWIFAMLFLFSFRVRTYGFTKFYRVLPSFTEFYRVLSGFTGFFIEFYEALPGFIEFYQVLPSFIEFSCAFVRFSLVLPVFAKFYRVLPSFFEVYWLFYRVSSSCIGFFLPSFRGPAVLWTVLSRTVVF